MSASQTSILGVTLRTRFGFWWWSTDEGETALWRGDEITALEKAGSHYFCRVVYGNSDYPKVMHGWIHKKKLRFSR
jgi:hypothetical protein